MNKGLYIHPKLISEAKNYREFITLCRESGINQILLIAWLWGHFTVKTSTLKKIKNRLEEDRFVVVANIMPFGHPGKAVSPNESFIDRHLPSKWTCRVDAQGEQIYYCACINEVSIEDNLEALQKIVNLGFTRIFYDDDTRLSGYTNSQALISGGCYCRDCLKRFSSYYRKSVSRKNLVKSLSDDPRGELTLAWIKFRKETINGFLSQVTRIYPSISFGVMFTWMAEDRSAIDVQEICRILGDKGFVRVGEYMYSNGYYSLPSMQAASFMSIQYHLSQCNLPAYGENTVFPPLSLDKNYLVKKILIDYALGIENNLIYLQPWTMHADYLKYLGMNKSKIEDIQKKIPRISPFYPIQITRQSASRSFGTRFPSPLFLLANLPAGLVGKLVNPAESLICIFEYESLSYTIDDLRGLKNKGAKFFIDITALKLREKDKSWLDFFSVTFNEKKNQWIVNGRKMGTDIWITSKKDIVFLGDMWSTFEPVRNIPYWDVYAEKEVSKHEKIPEAVLNSLCSAVEEVEINFPRIRGAYGVAPVWYRSQNFNVLALINLEKRVKHLNIDYNKVKRNIVLSEDEVKVITLGKAKNKTRKGVRR